MGKGFIYHTDVFLLYSVSAVETEVFEQGIERSDLCFHCVMEDGFEEDRKKGR